MSLYSADDFTDDLVGWLVPHHIVLGMVVVMRDRVTLEARRGGKPTLLRFRLETEMLAPELAEQLAERIRESITSEH